MTTILIWTYNVKEFDNHGMKVLTAISVQGLSPCTAPLQSSMQLCSQNHNIIRTSSNQCRVEWKLREHPIGQLHMPVWWYDKKGHSTCTALHFFGNGMGSSNTDKWCFQWTWPIFEVWNVPYIKEGWIILQQYM